MPGYDTERFVNLSQNDIAELSCGICKDILCNPLVTQCCLQSFCEDCITDWLKNNNNCPYDRKSMTPKELSRPSNIMSYMLGKLEIQCQFEGFGCKEVLPLENLSQHTINCEYKVENCKKCLSEIQDKSSHDCIKTLLKLNRKTNQEKESLLELNQTANKEKESLLELNQTANKEKESILELNRTANEEKATLLKTISDLKSEEENFLKIIKELSVNTKPQNSPNASSFSISEQIQLNQARISEQLRSSWNPNLIFKDMSADIAKKVGSVVRDEVFKFISISDICKNVANKLNTEFGSDWDCIVSHYHSVKSSCLFESGYFISFKVAELYFQIYKHKSIQ